MLRPASKWCVLFFCTFMSTFIPSGLKGNTLLRWEKAQYQLCTCKGFNFYYSGFGLLGAIESPVQKRPWSALSSSPPSIGDSNTTVNAPLLPDTAAKQGNPWDPNSYGFRRGSNEGGERWENWDRLSVTSSKNREGEIMKGGGEMCALCQAWRRTCVYLSVDGFFVLICWDFFVCLFF